MYAYLGQERNTRLGYRGGFEDEGSVPERAQPCYMRKPFRREVAVDYDDRRTVDNATVPVHEVLSNAERRKMNYRRAWQHLRQYLSLIHI